VNNSRPNGNTGFTDRQQSKRARRTVGVGESLEELSRRLGTGPLDVLSIVFARWSETVGEGVAEHVRPERLEGDALVVSVDSGAWASHLRTRATEVLSALREATGPSCPTRLVIRVKSAKKQASDQDL